MRESIRNSGNAFGKAKFGDAIVDAGDAIKYGSQAAGAASADKPVEPGPKLKNRNQNP